MRKVSWFGWIVAVMTVLGVAGCHHTAPADPTLHGEVFPADGDARAVWNVAGAQAAAGARDDATLYRSHFDATGLNSLGRKKLDLMLASEGSAEPVTVYLDVPAGAAADRDRHAVGVYFADRGLAQSEVLIVDGPNPNQLHSANDAVNQLNALSVPSSAQPQGVPAAAPPTNNVQPNYPSNH